MNAPVKNQERRRTTPSRMQPWDRFFGNDFRDIWDERPLATIPSINISEEKGEYVIEMAAPGLRKEDFKIDVDHNVLTISSERESETTDNYSHREYNYSSFARTFAIPENADAENISAKYVDGVLKLSIPKKKDTEKATHRISVQ